jgi:hypothetical protein
MQAQEINRNKKERIMNVESELSSARLETDILKVLKNSNCSSNDWEEAEVKSGHRYKAFALFRILVSKYI